MSKSTRCGASQLKKNDMIGKLTWTRTIMIVAAVASSISANILASTTTESSADYLRKVMLELRDMNLPPSPVPNHLAGPVYIDVDDRHFLAGKRYSNPKRLVQQNAEQQDISTLRTLFIRNTAKKIEPVAVDQEFSESSTHDQYYQIPRPVVVSAPQKVVTPEAAAAAAAVPVRAELTGMYNHAIEKETAMNLNALVNALRYRQMPSASSNQLEIAPAQPMYTYHFYPFKSFVKNFRQSHGLQAIQDSRPESSGSMMEESQKEMANPLFMAVSGFVGMAVLFMIGVLLIPRLGDFSFRVANEDEYLDLTKTVNEAIEKNCTNKFNVKDLNKRAVVTRKPVKLSRPSSVVLSTNKSVRQKHATKRRRKIERNCKIVGCKKNHRGAII